MPALARAERRGDTDRPRADDDYSFRAIVLHACTQCAIVPPPRITAATFTASDIYSGVMP